MTMTVKLDTLMEQQLRQRSAALGRPAGDIIREALQDWLAQKTDTAPSAFELGRGLFGRHSGPRDLAGSRKRAVADAWVDKHAQRG